MKFLNKNFSAFSKRAQTAIELAVFGAILVFILGIMVRQSLTFNYAQSQSFKAMRMAMAESFKTAEAGHSSRNFASLIFIEDRISAEIGKYGALTRTPAFAAASATFSKNLSMPIDYPQSLSGNFLNRCDSSRAACLSQDCSGAFFDGGSGAGSSLSSDPRFNPCCSPCNSVNCQITPTNDCCTRSGCEAIDCAASPSHPCCPPQNCPAAPDCVNNPLDPCCFPNGCPFVNCSQTPENECCFNPGCRIVDCATNALHPCCRTDVIPRGCDSEKDLPIMDMFINGKHFTFTQAGFREYNLAQGSPSPYPYIYSQARWNADWNNAATGCALYRALYTFVPNLSVEGVENTWSLNDPEFFNLDRDGNKFASPGVDVPDAERKDFDWQWQPVCAKTGGAGIDLATNKHARLDVDGDLKEETILQMVDDRGTVYTPYSGQEKGNHRIVKVQVLDDQAGDIDNTWTKNPVTNGGKPRPGLRDDLQIYTFTREGTYLLLEEGKDVNPEPSGNQTAVSTQKRNNADIVQRMIQLSNNTGRFCTSDGKPSPQNPDVEVCTTNEDCFSQNPEDPEHQNIYKTCFATDTLMLYVRSRIGDLRGRKWITDLGTRGY